MIGYKEADKLSTITINLICEGMEEYPSLRTEGERTALIQKVQSDLYIYGEENFQIDRFERIINEEEEEVLHDWVDNHEKAMQAARYYAEGLFLSIAEIDVQFP